MSPQVNPGKRTAAQQIIFCVCVIAVLARTLLFIFGAGQAPFKDDTALYWVESREIALGHRPAEMAWDNCDTLPAARFLLPSVPSWRAPLFHIWLALHHLVAGPWALYSIVAANHLLLLAATVMTCLTVFVLTRSYGAVTVVLLIDCLGVTKYVFATYVLSEPLASALLSASLLSSVISLKSHRYIPLAVTGCLFGLLTLTRTVFLGCPAALAIALYYPRPLALDSSKRNSTLTRVTILAAFYLMTVSPWLLRNQAIYGKPFLTTHGGIQLYQSAFTESRLPFPNSPSAAAIAKHFDLESPEARKAFLVAGTLNCDSHDPVKTSQLMQAVALEAVRANFVTVARDSVRRAARISVTNASDFGNYWKIVPEAVEGRAPYSDLGQRAVYSPVIAYVTDRFIRYGWYGWLHSPAACWIAAGVVMISLVLLATDTRNRSIAILMWGMCIQLFGVMGCLAVPLERYRTVLEPLFLLSVAVAAWSLWSSRSQGARLEHSATANSSIMTDNP